MDLKCVFAVIDAVLQANPRVLRDPAPVVQTILLGESSVHIGVRPWVHVQDYVPAAGEIRRAVLESLRSHGIVMPFPQREIRLIRNTA
jgi:small conductance mechanosensitive channel